jgi:hypothetical protein
MRALRALGRFGGRFVAYGVILFVAKEVIKQGVAAALKEANAK